MSGLKLKMRHLKKQNRTQFPIFLKICTYIGRHGSPRTIINVNKFNYFGHTLSVPTIIIKWDNLWLWPVIFGTINKMRQRSPTHTRERWQHCVLNGSRTPSCHGPFWPHVYSWNGEDTCSAEHLSIDQCKHKGTEARYLSCLFCIQTTTHSVNK